MYKVLSVQHVRFCAEIIRSTGGLFSMLARGDVLLIEDHRDIAEMVFKHLEECGYNVDYAADGVTGLHLAVQDEYDVVV